MAASLTQSEQKIVTAAVQRLAKSHECHVEAWRKLCGSALAFEENAMTMKMGELLHSLRSCLEVRT